MNAPTDFTQSPQMLREAFQSIKIEKNLRNREAAAALGVSEGEAVAAHVGARDGAGAIRLKGAFPDLIKAMKPVGEVMALTRNESVVHERTGTYLDASNQGHMGLVLGEDIDLRIFFSQWKHGFALTEETARGPQRSLQFFGQDGAALHKIYLKPQSNLDEYMNLVETWSAPEQTPGMQVTPRPAQDAPRPDSEIDVDEFQLAWASMKDTHDFFGVLKNFGLARTQALRLIGVEYAHPTATSAARSMLETVAAQKLPIMCFVGNPGIIQIHTGAVTNIKVMGTWLNVLDERFNLHLREDQIAESWVVMKPTTDGIVTSLELFDAQGETICMFFGKRKPGVPELASWRTLADQLPRA